MSEHLICPQCHQRYTDGRLQFCRLDGTTLYPRQALELVGQVLEGRYEIQQLRDRGRRSVGFGGRNNVFGKPVTIKLLLPELAAQPQLEAAFLKQAQTASLVHHPNVLDVIDTGRTADGALYQVLEFLEGSNLSRVLARQQRLPLFNVVNIIRQLAHALSATHHEGLAHLNLQPDSVFLVPQPGRRKVVRRIRQGETERLVVEPEGTFEFVKLLGWDEAVVLQGDEPVEAPPAGLDRRAMLFQAPERVAGLPVDRSSDVYSLGLLFYLMVSGERAFDQPPVPGATAIPPGWRMPELELNRQTNRAIMRCLEPEPQQRYQQLDELLSDLDHCFNDRVFLRHAARMPGAVEAGLVPDSDGE